MESVKKFLTNWWTVTGFIVLLCLGLLCIALPIFVSVLRPWWIRLIFGVVIIGVWAVFAFLRIRKARAASDALADELARTQDTSDESSELSKRMGEALGRFKTETGNRRDYLYSRPWYVIIGPPGAGKTTALLNSGLRFPFAEQAFKGVGGTRNLDFWFSEEAVLIDTAGRYTSQDSNKDADAKSWNSFLGLLKKHRPLQPVNGVMVAIGLDEIVRSDQSTLDQHAATVRRRLDEIRHNLEISVPVYILFTKADLLAGFAEFFDDLDVEGRRAVLGHTLDFDDRVPPIESLVAGFDSLAQSVMDRQAKRLHDELDPRRRSLILGFPAQIAALRARFVRFLEGVFGGKDVPAGVLRGFYLTSGVQQGATLDRLLGSLGDVYDQPHDAHANKGRAYFLNRLLSEVMFNEAGLVQMQPKARLRLKSQLLMAMGAIGAVCALTLVFWGISFVRNRGLQDNLTKQSQATVQLIADQGVDMVEVGPGDSDLEHSVAILDSLRALSQGYQDRYKKGAPLTMSFGLYQDGHSKRAQSMYREGLRRILLPRLLLRLESYLQANQSNAISIYEPLKVYLMLGGQKPDGLDAKTVKAWVSNDWERDLYAGADRDDLRKRLDAHLDALLEDKEISRSWERQQAPIDTQLVTSMRAIAQTLSMSDRAYAILAQKAQASGKVPWTTRNILSSGDALAFANGEAVLDLKVPYFYTREGFETFYQSGLATIQKDLENDIWVLGGDADTASVRQQINDIRPGVATHYAKDYIAAWEQVITGLKPADYFNNPVAFGAFTKTPSPLTSVLGELKKNTTFTKLKLVPQGMEQMAKTLDVSSRLNNVDAAALITSYFKPMHDYVGDGKSPAPVVDFIAKLKAAGEALNAAKSMGGAAGSEALQAQTATANAALKSLAATAPAGPIQGFALSASDGGSRAQTSVATGAVTQTYSTTIANTCQQVTQDRYPFFSGAQTDLSPLEAGRVFGAGGTLDSFVSQKLMAMLDTSGPVWRWRSDNPIASGLNPASASEFARAAEIRDLIAGGASFKVSAEAFGADVDAIEFSSGGTSYRFDLTTKGQARPMNWTIQATPEAHITLFKAGQQVGSPMTKEGPWALFRLLDMAKKQNSGTSAFTAQFGQGNQSATIKITYATAKNPFSRAGLWTFRCPVNL